MISSQSSRRGKVILSRDIITNEPELLKRIQDLLLILDMHYDAYTNTYAMLAINEGFDVVSEGSRTPSYLVQIEVTTGKIFFVKEALWDQSISPSHKVIYNTSQKNLGSIFALTLKNLMTASYRLLLKWCIKLKWRTDPAQHK